jgi:hypothetical protein
MPLTPRQQLPFAAIVAAGALVLAACPSRTAVEYRLPADYRGWVTVEYAAAACPPLQQREGRIIVPIDAAGRACTSSSFEDGEAADSFFYVRGGAKVPLPANAVIVHHNFYRCTEPGRPERRYEQFFVGTRGEPRPPLREPCFDPH